MRFDFDAALFALSYALDCVEHDLLGVTTNHGKRVAVLAVLLGREYGLETGQLQALAACAVLHDCALTEYVQEEYGGAYTAAVKALPGNLGAHCLMGERKLAALPFGAQTEGAVLYHHENADGTGPLGKTAEQTPLFARLIHIADTADAALDLSWMSQKKLWEFFIYLEAGAGTLFDAALERCFAQTAERMDWDALRNEKIDLCLQRLLPDTEMECTPGQLIDFSTVFAAVVDYKSHFTKTHSLGIAQKAKALGEYYGADEELAAKLYFAGALHDIGKLVVDRDVLEKPAGLTESEYRHIQTHVYYTYKILSDIRGLEDITRWASRHHEKLDGSGYPFGLKGGQLDRWERMMACLDIYQALTEDRPYKKGMSHPRAVEILGRMVRAGQLDGEIVDDIACRFAPEEA